MEFVMIQIDESGRTRSATTASCPAQLPVNALAKLAMLIDVAPLNSLDNVASSKLARTSPALTILLESMRLVAKPARSLPSLPESVGATRGSFTV
jgi:hypothetical protein